MLARGINPWRGTGDGTAVTGKAFLAILGFLGISATTGINRRDCNSPDISLAGMKSQGGLLRIDRADELHEK